MVLISTELSEYPVDTWESIETTVGNIRVDNGKRYTGYGKRLFILCKRNKI